MKSGAIEDYLKAIYELEEQEGRARTTRLAHKLNIRAGTVSEMIKRLANSRPRLIAYQHHQGVRLTQAGRREALTVIRKHRLLETFLHKTLGFSWDEVHEEAEVLEHHLSARVTDAIDRHLEFPVFDPHGEPIPDRDGRVQSSSDLRLSDLEEGDQFRIVRVVPVSKELLVYLDSMDMVIHTRGRILARAPLDGPISVRIPGKGGDGTHSLGRDVADKIFVEK